MNPAKIAQQSPPKVKSRRLDRFLGGLDRPARVIDAHSWLAIALLLVLYGYVIHHWRSKPFWYDELYTFYIAQAPSLHEMLLWIRQIDLNPPLYYIATRALFHIFPTTSVIARLPSTVAYLVAVLCLYKFVRRRLTPMYGLVGAFILLGSAYNLYAFEARPYALVLGFLGVAAVAWQTAIADDEPRRGWALLAVLLGGFGMLLSHVLALVAYAAFFVGEFVRLLSRRKTDWPLWVCLVVPLCSCWLYLPAVRQHSAGVYPVVFQASIQTAFEDYANLWGDIGPFLAMVLVILITSRPPEDRTEVGRKFQLSLPELGFTTWLLLVPLAIILEFMRTHSQFFPRYGIPAIFGVSILVPYLLGWWTMKNQRAATIAAAVFLFAVVRPTSIARVMQAKLAPPTATAARDRVRSMPLNQIEPDLPFVDADGLTFLEMNSRERPNFLARVYYLVDANAAFRYAHANGFNGMSALEGKFPIRGNIESYNDFIRRNRRFLVFGTYGTPDDWLLNKLISDGAVVRFLGEFQSTYKDHAMYEITLSSP